jgi:acetolactate synthase-1/2/3 large subunit
MNQLSGAETVVRMLQRHGIEHIFGLCGDTSLPLYDAFYRLDHGMTHILTRDERSAAYMADAYARVTGRVGVCEGPSGGGATYILPGVVEANESSIPVLAITTDVSVAGRGRYTLTELDQEALFRPLTKWNRVVDTAAEIPGAIRTAFTQMTSGRPGAAHIGLPFDVQQYPVDEASLWVDSAHGAYPSRRSGPDPEAIAAAADAILGAQAPLFICGGGPVIAGAEAELVALAERLEAPVATSISGRGSTCCSVATIRSGRIGVSFDPASRSNAANFSALAWPIARRPRSPAGGSAIRSATSARKAARHSRASPTTATSVG